MGDREATVLCREQIEAASTLPPPPTLDLSTFPTIYVIPTHVPVIDLHAIEQELVRLGARLTYDICEAQLLLANISKPRRARFELRAAKIPFRDLLDNELQKAGHNSRPRGEESKAELHRTKRPKLQLLDTQSTTDASSSTDSQDASSVISAVEATSDPGAEPVSQPSISQISTLSSKESPSPSREPLLHQSQNTSTSNLEVVKIQWLTDSIRLGWTQPLEPYLIYAAKRLYHDNDRSPSPEPYVASPLNKDASPKTDQDTDERAGTARGIIERARAEAAKSESKLTRSKASRRVRFSDAARRDFSARSFASTTHHDLTAQRPHLIHQTTSEYEEGTCGPLPPVPNWVVQRKMYSCERATPLTSPNDDFIAQLKEIRTARLLTNDEIGVRAYSTSIAAVAAYPYAIQSTGEVLTLPGCDQKIARLFHEWQTSTDRRIQAVKDIADDSALNVIRLFYEIWGVGATTAQVFYYDKKWRDLDDIVEFGWNSLSRVQQIGVKYYDEFLLKIPRGDVERIAATVTEHARKVVDDRIECVIVGGHRRGKAESGDVDLILSHPEQSATAGLVDQVVKSLEREGWITHTLILNLTNTKRGQEPLPYIRNTKGAGFDTLDKALVVWQDQAYPGRGSSDADGRPIKNPNVHRRVDIIISPWRTIGCAVTGWTSGTTFQRDLRRYAREIKGWKFDSSGVRERGSGRWVDLEGWADPQTRCKDAIEAERRVFKGLGLEYWEPWDRCTG
ncbi:MAG: hypothetical protein Q9220_007445 [cf. Caloplaca sp. 1 TL-2023]